MNQSHPIACFVHLGNSIPRHLRENIVRTRRLFPHLELLLITDVPWSLLGFSEELGVDVRRPFQGSDCRVQPPQLGWDQRFWRGYWQKTFDRLFALQEAFIGNPNRTVVHIESDVLLLPSFPFSHFEDASKAYWGHVGDAHDVAALLIIPDLEKLKVILDKLSSLAHADPTITDMTGLRRIVQDGFHDHTYLPMVPGDSGAREMGLFDGGPWGHYIYGTDPRAHYGFRIAGRTMKLSRFVPSESNLVVAGEQILVNGIPLHSLHVHSKAHFAFSDDFEKLRLRIQRARRQSQLFRATFVLSAFLMSMRTMLPTWGKSALSWAKWRRLIGRMRR